MELNPTPENLDSRRMKEGVLVRDRRTARALGEKMLIEASSLAKGVRILQSDEMIIGDTSSDPVTVQATGKLGANCHLARLHSLFFVSSLWSPSPLLDITLLLVHVFNAIRSNHRGLVPHPSCSFPTSSSNRLMTWRTWRTWRQDNR